MARPRSTALRESAGSIKSRAHMDAGAAGVTVGRTVRRGRDRWAVRLDASPRGDDSSGCRCRDRAPSQLAHGGFLSNRSATKPHQCRLSIEDTATIRSRPTPSGGARSPDASPLAGSRLAAPRPLVVLDDRSCGAADRSLAGVDHARAAPGRARARQVPPVLAGL